MSLSILHILFRQGFQDVPSNGRRHEYTLRRILLELVRALSLLGLPLPFGQRLLVRSDQ